MRSHTTCRIIQKHATLQDIGSPSGISPLRFICIGFRYVNNVADCFYTFNDAYRFRDMRIPCDLCGSLCTLRLPCSRLPQSKWNMNHWDVASRRLQMAALIVKEHMRLQDCQYSRLIHSTQEERFIGRNAPTLQRGDTRSWAGAFRAVTIAIRTIFLYTGSSLRRLSSSFCMKESFLNKSASGPG